MKVYYDARREIPTVEEALNNMVKAWQPELQETVQPLLAKTNEFYYDKTLNFCEAMKWRLMWFLRDLEAVLKDAIIIIDNDFVLRYENVSDEIMLLIEERLIEFNKDYNRENLISEYLPKN